MNEPQRNSSSWTVDNGRLVHSSAPDRGFSALEIWDAEFEPDRSPFSRPSDDICDLEFAAAHMDLRLELTVNAINNPVLAISAKLRDEDQLWGHWPRHDQIIVGTKWYPIDLASLAEVEGILAGQGIALGEPLNSAQLMWLYWVSDFNISPLSTEISATLDDDTYCSFEPDLVAASLYPYQVQGSRYLAEMAAQGLGVLLADEMGLGKTLQAIYLIASERKNNNGAILVVCPSSILSNWQREIGRFAPFLSVLAHRGGNRGGDPSVFATYDAVLTSYDVLVRDVALFDSVDWNLVVLDEAQAVKNPDARRSGVVRRLKKRLGLAITGTPIENSLKDMWSIFEFVAPNYLGSRVQFERQFPDEIEAARALSTRAAPLTIRRRVLDVATDLPPRVDIPTGIDVGSELAVSYGSILDTPNLAPLAMLSKLRQACASPADASSRNADLRSFAKYQVALEIMEEAFSRSEKVILFASYLNALDAISAELASRLPHVFLRVLDGRTSAENRQLAIDDFSAHEGPGVLLMNPRATGVGLNIQAASHVIHYTPEWNPAIVAQATARAYRRGQIRPVFIHYLYYVNTVEEVMIQRLEAKRVLQDAGMSEIDGELTPSDILEALSRNPLRSNDAT